MQPDHDNKTGTSVRQKIHAVQHVQFYDQIKSFIMRRRTVPLAPSPKARKARA